MDFSEYSGLSSNEIVEKLITEAEKRMKSIKWLLYLGIITFSLSVSVIEYFQENIQIYLAAISLVGIIMISMYLIFLLLSIVEIRLYRWIRDRTNLTKT